MSWTLSLWSDLECAGGSRVAEVHPFSGGSMQLQVNADEALTFAGPRRDSEGDLIYWVEQIRLMNVIRAEKRSTGEVHEWRVVSLEDVHAGGNLSLSVTADPVLFDLRRVFLAVATTGGSTYRNLGGIGMSIAQYIDTYVLPDATNAGMTWWSRGTVDNSDAIDLSWDGYTALELLTELARLKNSELRARRNGSSGYYIDVGEVGSGTSMAVPLDIDRSVTSVRRRMNSDGWANVLVPRGAVSPGAVDFGDIGDNRWEIHEVSSDGGGDYVAVFDPQSLGSPLAFVDQFNGLYLESDTDATREEIDDCEDGGTASTDFGTVSLAKLYLSDTTDYAVGDRVRIVADSSGTLLTELTHPASVSAYGRVPGYYSRPDQRTEAQFIRGFSFAADNWDEHSHQRTIRGVVDGNVSGTTLNLKDLPEGLEIAAGDLIGDTNGTWDAEVDTGDTVGADGLAQVTLDASMSATNNDVIPICVGMARKSGSPWPSTVLGYNINGTQGVYIRDWLEMGGVYASGQYDGNHSGSATFDVKGFDADTYYDGPMWLSADGSTYGGRWFVGGFKTDGDGKATVTVNSSFSPHSDGEPMGLWWPDFAGSPRASRYIAVTSIGWIQGVFVMPHFGVRYTPGRTTLYTGFGVSHWGTGRTFEETGSTTVYRTPEVSVGFRALGSAGGYSTTTDAVADYTTTTNEVFHVDHVYGRAVTEDSEVAVQLYMPHYRISNAALNVVMPTTDVVALRYMCAWLGPSQEPPMVEGSAANALWRGANDQLGDTGLPPSEYSLTLADLTEVVGFDPDTEQLILGAETVVRDRELGIETTVRIVGVAYDLADPLNSRVALARVPPKVETFTAGKRWTAQRADSSATLSTYGPEVRPAVREDDAIRAIPEAGASSSGGVVPTTTYES